MSNMHVTIASHLKLCKYPQIRVRITTCFFYALACISLHFIRGYISWMRIKECATQRVISNVLFRSRFDGIQARERYHRKCDVIFCNTFVTFEGVHTLRIAGVENAEL